MLTNTKHVLLKDIVVWPTMSCFCDWSKFDHITFVIIECYTNIQRSREVNKVSLFYGVILQCHTVNTVIFQVGQSILCESKKTDSGPQLHQISTDLHTFFTDGLRSKFATNSCLNIPPRLKHVTTLPCCQGWVASVLKFIEDWLHMYKEMINFNNTIITTTTTTTV